MKDVLPGADFALAPGVRTEKGCLRDALSRRHPLNDAALLVVQLAARPITVDDLTQAAACKLGLDPSVTKVAIEPFLVELQARGLGSIHQSFGREWLRHLLEFPMRLLTIVLSRVLVRVPWQSRRDYRPTVAGVARACVEGHQSLSWIGCAVGMVAAVVLPITSPTTVEGNIFRDASIGVIISGLVLCTAASAFVHECSHLFAARLSGATAVAARARLGAASVVFIPHNRGQRIGVALSGPIAGFLFSALMAALILTSAQWTSVYVFSDPVKLVLLIGCGPIGMAQLVALIPPSRDAALAWRKSVTDA